MIEQKTIELDDPDMDYLADYMEDEEEKKYRKIQLSKGERKMKK